MRGTSVHGSAILVALLLGAPGCATSAAVAEAPTPTAGLEPAASVGGPGGGGLSATCGKFMILPSGPELVGIVLLLSPVLLVAAPFVLAYAVVGTPLRVLTRRL